MKFIVFAAALNTELHLYSWVFHKVDEIGINVNVGIRGVTM